MRKGWLVVACALALPGVARAATLLEPTLRLTAEERYDGDVGATSGLGGEFMTKLTPRLGMELKSPTASADGFYALDFIARHGSGGTHFDHRAGVEGRVELSRRLRVDGALRLFRVTDPLSLPRQGLAAPRVPVQYGRATLGVTGRASQRWDVRGAYLIEVARLERNGGQPGFVHMPSVEAWYRTTPRLTLGADYRYQAFNFAGDYSQAHAAGALLRYRLTPLTTLGVRAGPVRYSGADGQGGLLPRYLVELAYDGEYYDLGAALGHDLVGASGLDGARWADFASVVGARRLNHRWNFYGAASFFRNGLAPGAGAFVLSPGREVSQGYALTVGAEWQFHRRATLQASVDRIAQLGTVETAADVDLTRNVVALRAILSAW